MFAFQYNGRDLAEYWLLVWVLANLQAWGSASWGASMGTIPEKNAGGQAAVPTYRKGSKREEQRAGETGSIDSSYSNVISCKTLHYGFCAVLLARRKQERHRVAPTILTTQETRDWHTRRRTLSAVQRSRELCLFAGLQSKSFTVVPSARPAGVHVEPTSLHEAYEDCVAWTYGCSQQCAIPEEASLRRRRCRESEAESYSISVFVG